MDQEELRASYLRLLRKAPAIKSAIVRAAQAGGGTVTLRFPPFDDNPFLLYASWGFARSVGVALVLSPDDAPAIAR